jgi:hypothetical protein
MDYQRELSNLITVAAGTASGWLIAQGYNAAFVGALIALAVAYLNNKIELTRQRKLPAPPEKLPLDYSSKGAP